MLTAKCPSLEYTNFTVLTVDSGIQLKGKLGNHYSCILSTGCHAVSQGTNLPSSQFDRCNKSGPLPGRCSFEKQDQIFSVVAFFHIMACKLENLPDFTPEKNLSYSKTG